MSVAAIVPKDLEEATLLIKEIQEENEKLAAQIKVAKLEDNVSQLAGVLQVLVNSKSAEVEKEPLSDAFKRVGNFNGEEKKFAAWKDGFLVYLEAKGLVKHVKEDHSVSGQSVSAQDVTMDKILLLKLRELIVDDLLRSDMAQYKSCKEAWAYFVDKFQPSDRLTVIAMDSKLTSWRIKNPSQVIEEWDDMRRLRTRLADLGLDKEEDHFLTLLLNALPEEYKSYRDQQLGLMRAKIQITREMLYQHVKATPVEVKPAKVVAMLKDDAEEAFYVRQAKGQTRPTNTGTAEQSIVKCLKCRLKGHTTNDCRASAEKIHRIKNRLCIKCGANDHMMRECPEWKKEAANAVAEKEDNKITVDNKSPASQ